MTWEQRAIKSGLSKNFLRSRVVEEGMSIQEACETPKNKRKGRKAVGYCLPDKFSISVASKYHGLRLINA